MPSSGGGGGTPLIPNGDLVPLPAEVTPIPQELLDGHSRFEIATTHSSTTLPRQFGFTGIYSIDSNFALVLQDTGGTSFRLDLYAGGQIQGGSLEWPAAMRMELDVDTQGGVITATTLQGSITYGSGWDTTSPTSGTRAYTPWSWTGTTASFGGHSGIFVFDGVIENIYAV